SGLAPAATLRRPSATIAWASTVAVVVPSPATSLVFVATSLASCAPRFSVGSSSSISRATVTPSLVIVGAPHFLSMTTLRPLGPSVTFTASARRLTPRSSARLASSSNSRLLAMSFLGVCVDGRVCANHATAPDRPRTAGVSSADRRPDRGRARRAGTPPARPGPLPAREIRSLLIDDGEHVPRGEHQVLLAVVLHLGAAVLAVQHDVPDVHVHRDALGAGVIETTGADRQDLALLGLL